MLVQNAVSIAQYYSTAWHQEDMSRLANAVRMCWSSCYNIVLHSLHNS